MFKLKRLPSTLIVGLWSSLAFAPEFFNANLHLPRIFLAPAQTRYESYGGLEVNFVRSSISSSYDRFANQAPLFGGFGNLDFGKFAEEKLSLTPSTQAADNIYENILVDGTKLSDLQQQMLDPPYNLAKEPLAVTAGGKTEVYDIELSGRYVLDNGLFLQGKVPFRSVEISGLELVTPNEDRPDALEFLRTTFDDILVSQNLAPLSEGYTNSTLTDAQVGAGWGAGVVLEDQFVRGVSGEASMGFILPLSAMATQKQDYFFYLPHGFKNHFGFYGQASGEIKMAYSLTLGGSAIAKSYFPRNHQLQLKHNPEVDFFYFLHRQEARVDLGSFWSGAGYIRGGLEPFGMNICMGYSYHSQEATELRIRTEVQEKQVGFYDQAKLTELSNLTVNALTGATNVNTVDPLSLQDRVSKAFIPLDDDLVNQDPCLKRWYFHVIHAAFTLQPKLENKIIDRPSFKFFYNYPIYGKSCFIAHTIESSMGFFFEFSL